jgi:dephospho-CoA kinase
LRRPLAVAITRGIGAGKSEALRAFARHGAAIVSSDEIVHHLIQEDDEVRGAILERLGDRVLDEDGTIDRGRVAGVVFADREQLAWLEALLHPRVAREYLAWREGLAALPNPPAVCVTEIPLLYETGGQSRFDVVVVVTAPPSIRAERAGYDIEPRSARLIPDEEKVERADFAYLNDQGLEELDEWVAGVLNVLNERAAVGG